MKAKKIFKVIILTIILSHFTMCKEANFYSYCENEDYIRLPIAKPIEILSYSGGNNWHIALPYGSIEGYWEIHGLQKIDLKENIIFIEFEALGFTHNGKSVGKAWLFIDTANKTQKIFYNKEELKDLSINFNLKKIRELFENFDKEIDDQGEWHLEKIK